MNLDQDIHAKLKGAGLKFGRLGIVECRHDQQNTVGAKRA